MTTLTYSLTRQQAADFLGVSTRTIDRYVVKGDLRYKKIANKVVLAQEDIERLHADLELIQQAEITGMPTTTHIESSSSNNSGSTAISKPSPANSSNRSNVKEFVELIQHKDATIEEKNQFIFALQNQIGQMESRLHQMIALPEYTQEKSQLEQQISTLAHEKDTLEEQIRKEKLWNMVYMALVMIAAIVVVVLLFF